MAASHFGWLDRIFLWNLFGAGVFAFVVAALAGSAISRLRSDDDEQRFALTTRSAPGANPAAVQSEASVVCGMSFLRRAATTRLRSQSSPKMNGMPAHAMA